LGGCSVEERRTERGSKMTKTAIVHSQQRWEYLVVTRRTETSLEKQLNELGQAGWDLVSVDHGKDLKGIVAWIAFVKRPATEQPVASSSQEQVREAVAQPSKEPEKAESPAGQEGFDLSGDEFGIKEE